MEKVNLIPMQQFLGVLSFLVFGGPHSGRQVMVRAYDRDWHEARWDRGEFAPMSREVFVREVLGEIGIVSDGKSAVPPELVVAVNAQIQSMRSQSASGALVPSLTTGFYSRACGWVRASFQTIPVPEAVETEMTDELLAQFEPQGSITATSLASRHRQAAAS